MKKYFTYLFCLIILFGFPCTVKAYVPITIKVGVYENFPKIYTDEKNIVSGFWPDLIRYIAIQEGWEIKWVSGTWSQGLENLEAGRINIMPDTGWTEPRSKKYAFSNEAVLVSWSRLYVQKGSKIKSIIDLDHQTIAGLKGSLNLEGPEGIKEIISKFNLEVIFKEMESYEKVFQALHQGKLIACNQKYKSIFGFKSTQHAMSTSISELFESPDERAEFLKLLNENSRVTNYEPKLKKVDGTPVQVIENVSGVFDENGDLKYIQGFLMDITEQRKLETQLRQSQKMEAIGTLAGGVAHDFNNILSGIFGYSELAQMSHKDPGEVKKYLKKVVKSAQRASHLVQQILTFSRQAEHKKQPLTLFLIVKEAIKFLRSSIPATIEIQDNISSKSAVLADQTQAYQVIINLCTNAYHAMSDSGGILSVKLEDVELSPTHHFAANPYLTGKYIKLEIKDTGHGMDKNTLERIFDPYFTTKETDKGTGLGLAVVNGIVKNHNGFVETYSELGRGSTFQVFWPIIEMKVSHITPGKEKIDLPKGTEKIMLVDDEQDLLVTTRTILEKQGYKVIVFDDSMSALQCFTKDPNQFDLVITDMTMPQMAGDELSLQILKIRKDMPIILCTRFSEVISDEKAVSLGIRGFLFKPIEMKDLTRKIREVLDF